MVKILKYKSNRKLFRGMTFIKSYIVCNLIFVSLNPNKVEQKKKKNDASSQKKKKEKRKKSGPNQPIYIHFEYLSFCIFAIQRQVERHKL